MEKTLEVKTSRVFSNGGNKLSDTKKSVVHANDEPMMTSAAPQSSMVPLGGEQYNCSLRLKGTMTHSFMKHGDENALFLIIKKLAVP